MILTLEINLSNPVKNYFLLEDKLFATGSVPKNHGVFFFKHFDFYFDDRNVSFFFPEKIETFFSFKKNSTKKKKIKHFFYAKRFHRHSFIERFLEQTFKPNIEIKYVPFHLTHVPTISGLVFEPNITRERHLFVASPAFHRLCCAI